MLSPCTCRPATGYFALLLIITSITYNECVSIKLVTGQANRIFPAPYYVLSYMACLTLPYFSTLSHKWHDFHKLT